MLRDVSPARGVRRAAGVLATAAAALYLMAHFFPAGVYTEARTDAAMLEDGESRFDAPLPAPTLLFPTAAGSRRTYRETPTGGDDDRGLRLETRVSRAAESGVVRVESRLDGAPFQTEVYRVDRRGVYGLATGPGGALALDPPLPLLPADAAAAALPGAARAWRGHLVRGGARTPAAALLRLDGPETVTTPAGTFRGVYRLDLRVRVGGAAATDSTLWLAPGTGVVRQALPTARGRVTLEYVGQQQGGGAETPS